MPLQCDTDSETTALLEIVVWNLTRFFGHSQSVAYDLMNEFYRTYTETWDDNFYHEEMPFRVAARVHYVVHLKECNSEFGEWILTTEWRESPEESLQYFRDHYFTDPVERKYYLCSVLIGGELYYFVWYSGDSDGIVLKGTGIQSFDSLEATREFCKAEDLVLSESKVAHYDLDEIERWVSNPDSATMGSAELLNFWNMMGDLYLSLGNKRFDNDDLDIHEKLCLNVFAVQIPEMLGDDSQVTPLTNEERIRAATILGETVKTFKTCIAR